MSCSAKKYRKIKGIEQSEYPGISRKDTPYSLKNLCSQHGYSHLQPWNALRSHELVRFTLDLRQDHN